jgi:anti-anti-sigma regulatory factor
MHNGAIMPSEVRHLVDTGQPYPVVQLTGMLDRETAPAVRSALLDVLAGQPEALVIDVDGLQVPDPAATAVLRDLARDTADWPGAHLVLCAVLGTALWHATGLPVWSSPAAAFADLGAPEPEGYLSLALEPVVGAARRSRELVTEACGRWDRPGLAGPACIVVTEMVNNVVAHVHTPMSVLLALRGDVMTVAVRDRSATVPRFTGPVAPTSYGGRGLLLIDSVAERWGSLVLADGKVVWAALQDGDQDEPAVAGKHLDSAGMGDPARG